MLIWTEGNIGKAHWEGGGYIKGGEVDWKDGDSLTLVCVYLFWLVFTVITKLMFHILK